jgi:hypothetical protein
VAISAIGLKSVLAQQRIPISHLQFDQTQSVLLLGWWNSIANASASVSLQWKTIRRTHKLKTRFRYAKGVNAIVQELLST